MTLIAHLGYDFMRASRFSEDPGLGDRMRKRLLHVDMLAALDGIVGRREMHVVGCAYHDRINFLIHFLQHHTIIGISFSIGILREGFGGPLAVDITECDDVFSRDARDVRSAFSATAHGGDVQLASAND